METIFGVATALGKSGVAVVRISGNAAAEALAAFGCKPPPPRQARLSRLMHNGQLVDEALVLFFKSPNSFTGEDVVELHTHGSRAVIKLVLEILGGLPNFRIAEPGEFSRRAFKNGRMDLTEAEGLADLIEADTTAQHRQAMRQMQGELGKIYDKWRDELVENLAHIEAYVDFPDEDLPNGLSEAVINRVAVLSSEIRHHLNDNRRGEKIREGIFVVILGAPNVGKSSILNFLVQRDAAIVSEIAGTTRDVIEVSLEIGGYPVIIADTAGLRETADAIESEGIRRALERAETADLKIVMFEAGAKDQATLKMVDDDAIIVVNKIDKAKTILKNGVGISVLTGEGMEKLLDALKSRIVEKFASSEPALITRARHREALVKALAALDEFSATKPIELMAEDLRYAAKEIGRITGRIEVDDILDVIFSQFCIGK